jgi:hypothetical protein
VLTIRIDPAATIAKTPHPAEEYRPSKSLILKDEYLNLAIVRSRSAGS